MDLRRAVTDVVRRWRLVLGTTLVVLALGTAATFVLPPRYTATAESLVVVAEPATRSPNVMTSGALYVTARMPSYAALGTSDEVLAAVVSAVGGRRTPEVLRREIAVSAVVETALIDVSATDADPALSALIANSAAGALATQIHGLESGAVDVVLATPATRPAAPANRRLLVNGAVAAAGGFVVGCAAALATAALRRHRPRRGAPEPETGR